MLRFNIGTRGRGRGA